MKHEAKISSSNANKPSSTKKIYTSPILQIYGKLNRLTQGSGGSGNDAGGNMTKMSDKVTKENIIKIANHPLGIGLYLFNYKAEFKNVSGHGRQFGVMADEVETVMPKAVSIDTEGYKNVNYTMLGIQIEH